MSATSRTRNSKSSKKVGHDVEGHAVTERLERLAAQHPKLVRALEKEDASELYK